MGGIGRAKYTTGIRLGTSHDRGRKGLVAERWRHFAEGQLPLGAISDMCGFSSQAHLTRWFKRIVGVTPGAYRAG